MNELRSGPITRYRREIRAGLIGLAGPVVVVGGWALIAPHSWYQDFPIASAHWISSLGAYQEHLVRDFGSLYLALGLLLLFAAVVLDRLLVTGVLGASLVFQVPHVIFHATNTEPFSTGANVVNLATLAGGVVLTMTLLGMVSRQTTRTKPATETIEGGLGYGTR
jgi:hypothetical protein